MPKDPQDLVRKEVTINGMKTTLRLTADQAAAMPDVEPYATDPNAEATDLVTSGSTGRRRGARSTARGSARSTTRGTVEGSASDDAGDGNDSDKE